MTNLPPSAVAARQFSGNPELVESVLNTIAEVTTSYDADQIKPSMTLVGYMQLDPESDIPMLVKKLNKQFGIELYAEDIADQDPTVEDLIDLVESEIDLG